MTFHNLVVGLGIASLLGPAAVWAAKPPGAGGSDTTPPAAIASIDVKTSALALTLRFAATGDDGTAGTAAAYDVFYRNGTSCSDADNPGTNPDANPAWNRATRSIETNPETASVVDFFNLRPLVADQGYCVAIRVRDEVPNWSAWRVVHGMTSRNWSLAQSRSVSQTNAGANATQINLVLVNEVPVAGWMVGGRTAVFEGDGWRQEVPLVMPSTAFQSPPMRLAGNPGASPEAPTASAAVTMAYTSGSGKNAKLINEVLLVDAGPAPSVTRVTTIASGAREAGGIDEPSSGGSTIAYVLRDGTWNPAATLERIDVKGSGVKRTTLTITERVGQSWQDAPVLTREGPDQRYGFFEQAVIFTKPGGTTLGFVGPHCGITVYAERTGTGSWSYWDAGKALTGYRTAFDSSGSPIVLGQDTTVGAPMVVLHSEDFFALSGKPSALCTSVLPQARSPGEVVHVAPEDPDLPYRNTSGIAIVRDAAGAATFISAAALHGNYKTVEQRMIYRCSDADAWRVQTVDRTNSPHIKTQPVMNGAGDLLQGYSWGRFARAGGGQYSVDPPDYIYVAIQTGNPCGVVPAQ